MNAFIRNNFPYKNHGIIFTLRQQNDIEVKNYFKYKEVKATSKNRKIGLTFSG